MNKSEKAKIVQAIMKIAKRVEEIDQEIESARNMLRTAGLSTNPDSFHSPLDVNEIESILEGIPET